MNRRGFLATLAAGLTFDLDRALWVRGEKLISIAAPKLKLYTFPGNTVPVGESTANVPLSHWVLKESDIQLARRNFIDPQFTFLPYKDNEGTYNVLAGMSRLHA